MQFHAGDVVLCNFPYREDPTKWKRRPALVLKAVTVSGKEKYTIAQITTTDRTHDPNVHGKLIDIKSSAAKQMGLLSTSFVNLSTIKVVSRDIIKEAIGSCPIFSELMGICTVKGIHIP